MLSKRPRLARGGVARGQPRPAPVSRGALPERPRPPGGGAGAGAREEGAVVGAPSIGAEPDHRDGPGNPTPAIASRWRGVGSQHGKLVRGAGPGGARRREPNLGQGGPPGHVQGPGAACTRVRGEGAGVQVRVGDDRAPRGSSVGRTFMVRAPARHPQAHGLGAGRVHRHTAQELRPPHVSGSRGPPGRARPFPGELSPEDFFPVVPPGNRVVAPDGSQPGP